MKKLITDRKIFILFFIFYIFTNTLALGYLGITVNPLGYIVIGWACVLFIYELIHKQIIYPRNHLLFIFIYGALLLVATLSNSISSKNSYIMVTVQLIIFVFIFGKKKDTNLKMIKDELRDIIPFTSILVFCASFISLLTYFFNIYDTRNGWYIGLVNGRLFGIYFNCNPASFLCIMVILMSLYALKNKFKFRMLYIVNIVVQLLYVILTGTRAALIILIISVLCILYYKVFRKKEMSYVKMVLISVGICFVFLFGASFIQKVLSIIPKLQGAVFEDSGRFQLDKVFEIMRLIYHGNTTNLKKAMILIDEISSGRLTLFKTSIKIWQSSPFSGIGAYNFREMMLMLPEYQNVSVGMQMLHTHNVFVETLVTAGIMGICAFGIFFMKSCFVIRDVFIKYKNSDSYFIILLFVLIVLSDFIGGFFDFGVFYNYSLSSTLSWLFLGYLYWLNDHKEYTLINSSRDFELVEYKIDSISYEDKGLALSDLQTDITDINNTENEYVLYLDIHNVNAHFVYKVIYRKLNDVSFDVYHEKIKNELYELVRKDIFQLIK